MRGAGATPPRLTASASAKSFDLLRRECLPTCFGAAGRWRRSDVRSARSRPGWRGGVFSNRARCAPRRTARRRTRRGSAAGVADVRCVRLDGGRVAPSGLRSAARAICLVDSVAVAVVVRSRSNCSTSRRRGSGSGRRWVAASMKPAAAMVLPGRSRMLEPVTADGAGVVERLGQLGAVAVLVGIVGGIEVDVVVPPPRRRPARRACSSSFLVVAPLSPQKSSVSVSGSNTYESRYDNIT